MSTELEIRVATADDADALSNFARRVFERTFGPDNSEENMALYIPTAFSPDIQRQEILASDRECLLALADERIVAYALMRRSTEVPPSVSRDITVEIQRFYVDHSYHGRGLAKTLMEHCRRFAGEQGSAGLWLGVWERNLRAIRFYERQRFRPVGTQPFMLGNDMQTDFVMECMLRDDDHGESSELRFKP